MTITELAHKHDVSALLEDCENYLKDTHEIPIIDRLLLADRLKLHNILVSSTSRRSYA